MSDAAYQISLSISILGLTLALGFIGIMFAIRSNTAAIREQTRYNRELWGSPKEWDRAKIERAPWQ